MRKQMTTICLMSSTCLALLLLGTGCVSSLGGGSYSRDEARQEQSVDTGSVVSVRDVTIEGTSGVVGGVAGGATGAVVGSTMGSGTGKTVATVLGGVAGALGGAAVEKKVTTKQGVEITVQLDSGRTIAVVQQKEENITFAPGDRVEVLKTQSGTTRVRR